jgi:hypothetical protein
MHKMPIDWYSKKHSTVETATYSSKFIAAWTCIDQVINVQLTLCYLGVPIHKFSYISLVTTKLLSRVQPSHMPNFTSDAMHSPSTGYRKHLHLSISSWCTCPVQIILLTFWASIGHIKLSTQFWNQYSFSGNTSELIPEGWLNTLTPPLDIPYRIICFAFYILFCKGLEMMGSDKIHTASHTYVHDLSLCHLYPLPVTWRVTIVNFQKIPFLVLSSHNFSL